MRIVVDLAPIVSAVRSVCGIIHNLFQYARTQPSEQLVARLVLLLRTQDQFCKTYEAAAFQEFLAFGDMEEIAKKMGANPFTPTREPWTEMGPTKFKQKKVLSNESARRVKDKRFRAYLSRTGQCELF